MVQTNAPTAEAGDNASTDGGEVITPEERALIDQLVPPPNGRHRVLGAALFLLLALLAVAGPEWWNKDEGDPLSIGLNYPLHLDEERGLVGIRGTIRADFDQKLRIVDLTINASGAELVEFELFHKFESPQLPFEVSTHADGSTEWITLAYTAWLEPLACDPPTTPWGVVAVTYEDSDGERSTLDSAPYESFRAIPAELSPLGAHPLTVACEAVR